MTAFLTPDMPDAMGAWSGDDGTAWLPRHYYPTREAARTFYSEFTGTPWIEVSVPSRFARHAPEHERAAEFDGDYWVECDKDEPGAFRVWRCE